MRMCGFLRLGVVSFIVSAGVHAGTVPAVLVKLQENPDTDYTKAALRSAIATMSSAHVLTIRDLLPSSLARDGRLLAGPLGNVLRIELRVGDDAAAVASLLTTLSHQVVYAEADVDGRAASTSVNDTEFFRQWSLHNEGQIVEGQEGIPSADIHICTAWAIHSGNSSVTVAVVGTGVDPHSEYDARLLEGIAVVGDLFDSRDTCPHGTHVAGIIAAATNNGVGIAGVQGQAKILPVRVFDGCAGSASAAAVGICWAVDHGADVIVVPLAFSSAPQVLSEAVTYAVNSGVPVVAPVGNTGSNDLTYPAGLTDCIGVSATDNRDELADFSNFGGHVELSAPGASVYATWIDDGFAYNSGTSSAAAHVAGVVALIKSFAPAVSVDAVRTALAAGADPIGEVMSFGAGRFGAGRLNAFGALQQTESPALRFEFSAPPPTLLPPGHSLTLDLIIEEVSALVIAGTPALAYRVDGGSLLTAPLSNMGGQTYRAIFPEVPCGSVLEYFFQAVGRPDTVVTDPIDAPAHLHRATAIRVETLFEDAFEVDESGAGWMIEAAGGAETTGGWVRTVPVGTVAQPGFDHSPDAGSMCFITGQHFGGSAGMNDVDFGPVRLTSPIIALAGEDVEVSYARWFSTMQGEEADFLTVEASLDGGVTWIVVEQTGGTNGWGENSFRVGELATPTTDQLVLRFSTSDLADDSLTEAAVDDVVVRAFFCTPAVGDLDGDGRVTLSDWSLGVGCWTGPGVVSDDSDCLNLDVDVDFDVDLRDIREVFNNMTADDGG